MRFSHLLTAQHWEILHSHPLFSSSGGFDVSLLCHLPLEFPPPSLLILEDLGCHGSLFQEVFEGHCQLYYDLGGSAHQDTPPYVPEHMANSLVWSQVDQTYLEKSSLCLLEVEVERQQHSPCKTVHTVL